MYTVSELVGVSKNNGRGLVVYLTTSHGRQTQSGQTFERMLGTLGRDLRHTGGVVVAFPGDEDAVSKSVLAKPWDKSEKATISQRPGLLIIDKNFDDFDTRIDNWFHIDLKGIYNASGNLNERSAEKLVIGLQQIFLNEQDMFYHLNDRKIVERRKEAWNAVSINPSWFGLGVDVKKFIASLLD
jgi:hypothetical protein